MLSILTTKGVLRRIPNIKAGQFECQKFIFHNGKRDWIGEVYLNGKVVAKINDSGRIVRKGELVEGHPNNVEVFAWQKDLLPQKEVGNGDRQ
jgi:hypothetical protein